MATWKKIVLGAGILLGSLVIAFVTVVGPWPTYSGGFEGKGYFKKALAAIDENAGESTLTDAPGRLQAGWARASITPKLGTPMAGYSDREGAPSEGVHDELLVKALALGDGEDVVVLVGADMLLVPDNVANLVRAKVAEQTPLTPNDLYFGASHSHCSVGALAPGFMAKVSFGEYDPDIPPFLADAFTKAIVEAYESMKPAKLAHGSVDAGDFIRNRTRDAAVDKELNYLVVEQDGGERCVLTSFSAHPTALGGDYRMMTGSYPGFLQRAVERQTGYEVVYLGGALGSMGYKAPDAPSDIERSEAMGEGLAKLLVAGLEDLEFASNLDVASIGIPLEVPPLQLRPQSAKWRLSPIIAGFLGLDRDAWMQAARVGNVAFVGVPADFSGEISVRWKQWAEAKGYDLWTTSFSGDYVGYISPDEYYGQVVDEKGRSEYEIALMSWCGPHQEAFFTALMERMIAAMDADSA